MDDWSKMEGRGGGRWAWALGCLLPALAAILVLLPALSGGFLADDFMMNYFLDHEVAEVAIAWPEVLADFARPWMGMEGSGNYRPLISLHYALDIALGGGDAWSFHLSNILAHALASLFCALLCGLLCARRAALAALVGGLIFALHPAAVETSAWIAGRVSGTQSLFSLAALASFAWYRRRGNVFGLASAWLLAALALLCKESAVVLPVSLVAVDLLGRFGGGWRAFLGRHLFFAPLWLGYFALRHMVIGSLLGEGLEGRGAQAASPGRILELGIGKLAAVVAPFGRYFRGEAGRWSLDLETLRTDLAGGFAEREALLETLLAIALIATAVLVVWIVLRAIASWRHIAVLGIALAWLAAFFAPAWDFPVNPDLGGARLVYESTIAWAALVCLLLVDGGPRLRAALLIPLLLGTLGGYLQVQRELLGRYQRGWEITASIQRSIEALGADCDASSPLVAMAAPIALEGVPILNPNAVFPLGEPPYAAREIPLVGLGCVLSEVLHSEDFFLDSTALRALYTAGGRLVSWGEQGESIERRRSAELEGDLPEEVPLGGERLRYLFAEVLPLAQIPPLLIEEVDLVVAGAVAGGRLRWIPPPHAGEVDPALLELEFHGGRSFEGLTLFRIDLASSATFLLHDLLAGPVLGFELLFDPPLAPEDVKTFTLRRVAPRLELDTPLAGTALRLGEEDLVLHVPAGIETVFPATNGLDLERALVLMGPHAALRVPIGPDGRVRFGELVARDLRRILRLSRQRRFYYYFELRDRGGRAVGRARSEIDWFTVRD